MAGPKPPNPTPDSILQWSVTARFYHQAFDSKDYAIVSIVPVKSKTRNYYEVAQRPPTAQQVWHRLYEGAPEVDYENLSQLVHEWINGIETARIQDRTSNIENLKELAKEKVTQILSDLGLPKAKPTAPTVQRVPKSPETLRLWRRPVGLYAQIALALVDSCPTDDEVLQFRNDYTIPASSDELLSSPDIKTRTAVWGLMQAHLQSMASGQTVYTSIAHAFDILRKYVFDRKAQYSSTWLWEEAPSWSGIGREAAAQSGSNLQRDAFRLRLTDKYTRHEFYRYVHAQLESQA